MATTEIRSIENSTKPRNTGFNHLQPTVKEIPSYVLSSYFVSLDVKSLYINILNGEGIKSVKTSLKNVKTSLLHS